MSLTLQSQHLEDLTTLIDLKKLVEWIIRYIWKQTQSCSFFMTLYLKKLVALSRLFLTVDSSIFYILPPWLFWISILRTWITIAAVCHCLKFGFIHFPFFSFRKAEFLFHVFFFQNLTQCHLFTCVCRISKTKWK